MSLKRRFHKYTDDCESFEWIHNLGDGMYYIIQLRDLSAYGDDMKGWFWQLAIVVPEEVESEEWEEISEQVSYPINDLDDEAKAGYAFEFGYATDCRNQGHCDNYIEALMAATLSAQW